MSDPNTPADPNQPPPYSPGGYGQPGAAQPGAAQPGPYSQPGPAQPGPYGQPGPTDPSQPGAYGQPGQYPPPGGYAQAPVSRSDEQTWAALGHFGGILIGFIAGLIVYLVYKDRSGYLKTQGAEALNFQITIAIAALAASILTAVSFGLLFFLPFVVWVVQIVFGILAGLATLKHEDYRYPLALRLIK